MSMRTLGLVAAILLAACGSSRNGMELDGGSAGRGGSSNGGASGTGGGSGGSTGGTGGRACERVECLRPYECVRTCGGPIEYTGCCACEAPLFDDFLQMACGGSTGSAGRGGTGGMTTGSGGSAGTAGTAGRGGSSGAAGTGGTGTAGRGGTGGGTAGTGGSGGRACELFQCARPYECVRTCGGPIEYSGCCTCEPPLFDNFQGRFCADGGQPRTGYAGCTFIGGLDRVVISRCDAAAGLAINVVLTNNSSSTVSSPGLTVPAPWGVERVGVSASIDCPTRGVFRTEGSSTSVTGTITWATLTGGAGSYPASANVDLSVALTYQGTPLNATLKAQNIDVRSLACN